MRLRAAIAGLGVLLWASTLVASGEGSFEGARETARSNSVALLTGDVESGVVPILVYECSGLLLDSHTVVSAAHCLDGRTHITAASGSLDLCEGEDWHRFELQVSEVFPSIDLVVLEAAEEIVGCPRNS